MRGHESSVSADWRPSHTGLLCTSPDKGTSKWVHPDHVELYKKGGEDLLKLCEKEYNANGQSGVKALIAEAEAELKKNSLSIFLENKATP